MPSARPSWASADGRRAAPRSTGSRSTSRSVAGWSTRSRAGAKMVRPGGRRDRSQPAPRRGPRAGRGVGQRQDDDRAGRRQADPPDGRHGSRSRVADVSATWGARRAARLPPSGPDHLPGPVRDARTRSRPSTISSPSRSIVNDIGNAAMSARPRSSRRSRRPACGRRATSRPASRTSCPAASASAS